MYRKTCKKYRIPSNLELVRNTEFLLIEVDSRGLSVSRIAVILNDDPLLTDDVKQIESSLLFACGFDTESLVSKLSPNSPKLCPN